MQEKEAQSGQPRHDPAADLPSRYEAGSVIATGGMGELLVATDIELQRQVVLKFLRPDLADDEEARLQFIAEAQISGQLDHPGIPPVHEFGRTPAGRLYYSMKRVHGETLAAIVNKLAADPVSIRSTYSLRDLVSALAFVADTLAFAHDRGVVHRDVKPENIMIGTHREVHLMDWGVAKVRGGDVVFPEPGQPARVRTVLHDRDSQTRFDQLKGTKLYASPEQLVGESDAIDGRSDIYSLGCVLYEVTTLRPPFDPKDANLFVNKLGGHVREAQQVMGWPRSGTLLRIAAKAMATRVEDRYHDAAEMAGEMRHWVETRVERTRRRRASAELSARGRSIAKRYVASRQQLTEAEQRLQMQEASLDPWQPLSDKKALFAARRAVDRTRVATQLLFEQACQMLEAARVHYAGNKSATRALSALWRSRLLDSESTRNTADARMAVIRLRQIHGRVRSFFRGNGTLQLDVAGEPAEVLLYALREKNGFMTKRSRRSIGPTPVRAPALPAGSYVAVLRRPGSLAVRYPIEIRRGGSWTGKVSLPRKSAVPDEFAFVPGGPFWFGRGGDRAWLELPNFAIQRHPVTFSEYVQFLINIERTEGLEHALARLPRTHREPLIARIGVRKYRVQYEALMPAEARRQAIQLHGEKPERHIPVVGVSYGDALAYCRWQSERTGRRWRIPSEEEWEKAARGVDGRTYPWGEVADPCLAKCRDSRPGLPFPEPVGTFREARSLYGMADAAGGVWEWTRSWLDKPDEARVVRGGSWGQGAERCATWIREGRARDHRGIYTGFRCLLLL